MGEITIDLNDKRLSRQDRDQLKRTIQQKNQQENIIGNLHEKLKNLSNNYMLLGNTYNTLKNTDPKKMKEISMGIGNIIVTYDKNGIDEVYHNIEKTRKMLHDQIEPLKKSLTIEKKNLRECENKIVNLLNKVNSKDEQIPYVKTNQEKREEIEKNTNDEFKDLVGDLKTTFQNEMKQDGK